MKTFYKAGDSDVPSSIFICITFIALNGTNEYALGLYVLSVSSALNKGGAKFMGNVAVTMQEYLGCERFADLFNSVFHGEQVPRRIVRPTIGP